MVDFRNYEATKGELLSMQRASLIRKELSRSKRRSYETTKNKRPISTSDTGILYFRLANPPILGTSCSNELMLVTKVIHGLTVTHT